MFHARVAVAIWYRRVYLAILLETSLRPFEVITTDNTTATFSIIASVEHGYESTLLILLFCH
jgi:hypothetical protein